MIDAHANPAMLIYGAGAVGCLLGGLLATAGCRVTLLGRQPTGEAIREGGLRLSLQGRASTVHPRFAESVSDVADEPDNVVLAVRAYDVERSVPDLRRLTGEKTTLISVQNGLGAEELMARELPGVSHVAASLTLSAEFTVPGAVTSTSRSGGIALAPVSADVDVRTIAERFIESGVQTATTDDYRSMKWSKLLLNMMANVVPAILGWTPGEAYRNPETFRIERAALLEASRVLRADGSRLTSLPGFPVPLLPWAFRTPEPIARRLLLPRVEGGRGEKKPSLLLDLEAGREQTEAAWLYGAVVEAGRRTDIPTPVNRRLLRVMEAITVNADLRASFRDRPDRLARNVVLGQADVDSLIG